MEFCGKHSTKIIICGFLWNLWEANIVFVILSHQQKRMNMENTFDPNAAAVADSGIYGLPCTAEEAQIIIIPVEWERLTDLRQ